MQGWERDLMGTFLTPDGQSAIERVDHLSRVVEVRREVSGDTVQAIEEIVRRSRSHYRVRQLT